MVRWHLIFILNQGPDILPHQVMNEPYKNTFHGANVLPRHPPFPIPQSASPVSMLHANYRKVSNISRTLVGNKIVDHSDVVGASPVGAAPTTSSFST